MIGVNFILNITKAPRPTPGEGFVM